LDVSEVVLSSEFAEAFSVARGSGEFQAGGWSQQTSTVPLYGVVNPATARQLEMLPEGDRPTEALVFFCTKPLYVTSQDRGGTSDVITWRSEQYRILSVMNYSNRGYYMAIAERMAGE
jgi:hypothetical protein